MIVFVNIKSHSEARVFEVISRHSVLSALDAISRGVDFRIFVYMPRELPAILGINVIKSWFQDLSNVVTLIGYEQKNRFGEIIDYEDKPDPGAIAHVLSFCHKHSQPIIHIRPTWLFGTDFLIKVLNAGSENGLIMSHSLPMYSDPLLSKTVAIPDSDYPVFIFDWFSTYLAGEIMAALDFGKYAFHDFSRLAISDTQSIIMNSLHADLLYVANNECETVLKSFEQNRESSFSLMERARCLQFSLDFGYGKLMESRNFYSFLWRGRTRFSPNNVDNIADWLAKRIMFQGNTVAEIRSFLDSPFHFRIHESNDCEELVKSSRDFSTRVKARIHSKYGNSFSRISQL